MSEGQMKPLNLDQMAEKKNWIYYGLGCLIIILGVGSGFGLNKLMLKAKVSSGEVVQVSESGQAADIKVGNTYGEKDEIFSSETVGVIKEGGLEGEGTHHLEREGGESQTAYLTSSVVDLDQFVDRKVEVYGETFAGQKAGWLMDIGAVKVLE